MTFDPAILYGLLTALGGGLLIGVDRERRKGDGPDRDSVGLRTCMLVTLNAAVATLLGTAAVVVAGLATIAFAMSSYARSREADPGLTTEFALVALYLLGALAMTRTTLAAALFVVLAVALVSKRLLHGFVRDALGERDITDALLLAAAVLIVLPLLPDRTVDPLGVLNPRSLWLYAILVMAINAAGYIALRVFGPGHGLALAGFFGGFVSSTATIAGMAQRARDEPELTARCSGAALLSNVATVVQLVLILLAVSPGLLRALSLPLAAAGLAALAASGLVLWRGRGGPKADDTAGYGRPFAVHHAVLFAVIVGAALFVGALLREWLGSSGVLVAAGATGFADVHAAAVSLGQVTANAGITPREATFALCLAFGTNSLMKCIAAATGGRAYALPVIAGLLVINAALVGTILLTGPI